MNKLESLEEFAAMRDIPIYRHLPLDKDSCSIYFDGMCAIAIPKNKEMSSAEQTVCLAHELGHCETLSFYNPDNIKILWGKYEYRANKWAIKKLISKQDLVLAINEGYTEPWQLAEYFNLPEHFVRKALLYYQNGYIA